MRLRATAGALRRESGSAPNDPETGRPQAPLAEAREALDEEAFANLWAEGRRLSPERALDSW